MYRAWVIASFVFLLCASAWSQDANWQNLSRLKAGNKVEVVETNLRTTQGKFVRFSETDITLRVADQEQVIPREQVYRVSQKGRSRNALLGLAIGAGAGLGLGAAAMEREKGYAGAVAGTGALLGGIGAGIGAAVPHTKTLYRSSKSPVGGAKRF